MYLYLKSTSIFSKRLIQNKYVGRLVVDFDENGVIIPESIDPNISGAYATDAEGVTAVNGTPDPEIVAITEQGDAEIDV